MACCRSRNGDGTRGCRDRRGHHGTAAYDETTVTVSGIVTEFKFVNPHVLDLVGREGRVRRRSELVGRAERTQLDGARKRAGTATPSKPGDQVTITGRPAKNRSHTMAISKIC